MSDAREFFGWVRRCAKEAERTRRTLERMESAEGVRGASLTPSVSHSREDVNGTARTVARMDYEERMRSRLDECYRALDRACDIIYGSPERGHERGGVDALLGSAVADCMWWRFCAAADWDEVAANAGYSKSQARRLVDVGLDGCDFFGEEVLKVTGVGKATDEPEPICGAAGLRKAKEMGEDESMAQTG